MAIYMQTVGPTSFFKKTTTRICIHNHELKNHGNAVTAQRIILLLRPMFKVVYHFFQ